MGGTSSKGGAAKAEAANKYRPSPLYVAADKGDYVEVVRLVEEERVDVNHREPGTKPPGGTALGAARSHVIAKYLLDHAADYGKNYVGWDGRRSSDNGKNGGDDKKTIKETAKTKTRKIKDSTGKTIEVVETTVIRESGIENEELPPFLFATVHRRPFAMKAIMEILGKETAVRLASYEAGHSAVTLAGMCGYPEILRTLHDDLGADLNVATKDSHGGQTALHLAAVQGKGQALNMLLTLGADLEKRDVEGRTPLAAVCAIPQDMNHRWVIDHLLDARADLEPVDSRGWRPIHYCALHGNFYALRGLTEMGADGTVEMEKVAKAVRNGNESESGNNNAANGHHVDDDDDKENPSTTASAIATRELRIAEIDLFDAEKEQEEKQTKTRLKEKAGGRRGSYKNDDKVEDETVEILRTKVNNFRLILENLELRGAALFSPLTGAGGGGGMGRVSASDGGRRRSSSGRHRGGHHTRSNNSSTARGSVLAHRNPTPITNPKRDDDQEGGPDHLLSPTKKPEDHDDDGGKRAATTAQQKSNSFKSEPSVIAAAWDSTRQYPTLA